MYDTELARIYNIDDLSRRAESMKNLKKTLFVVADFVCRSIFECSFEEIPGAHPELIPQFAIDFPNEIPPDLMYSISYVHVLDSIRRWMERPYDAYESGSVTEELVVDLALNAGFKFAGKISLEKFQRRRSRAIAMLDKQQGVATKFSQVDSMITHALTYASAHHMAEQV